MAEGWESDFTSTMFMKCNKNSCASCCLLVENSGWPRPTSALNILGAMPIWSPCKQKHKNGLSNSSTGRPGVVLITLFIISKRKFHSFHEFQSNLIFVNPLQQIFFFLPWVQMNHFHLQGLVLVWNILLTTDRSPAWLCDKQTKLTSLHIQQ